jgi:methylated-DNA-[protein]-cysteine S-methyltransferase
MERTTVTSPIGPLLLVRGERGLVRIAAVPDAQPDGDAPAPLRDAARQLDEYFAGRRHRFELELDLTGVSPFTRRVLDAAAAIPYGSTTTYEQLARAAGAPGSARATGGVMARNPLVIVIPCHRVLRSDGGLAGYGAGGPAVKRMLLDLEAA